MAHDVFSIVAPVVPVSVAALRERLNPSGNARQSIKGLPLDRIPTLHFASFVVFDGQEVTEKPGRMASHGRWTPDVQDLDSHVHESLASLVPGLPAPHRHHHREQRYDTISSLRHDINGKRCREPAPGESPAAYLGSL
jgi:hypothetical protein